MSTTRVLHVIARMNVGGTARYVRDLVENIPGSALATGYIQGAEIEDPNIDNLTVYRIPHLGRRISPLNDFRAWLELRALVKQLKPEIIHTHTFKAGLIGRLLSGGHKRVHTFHGHLFGDESFSPAEKRMITLTEKFLARRTDLLISVGEKVGVELRAKEIGPKEIWLSIPPGVNPLRLIDKQRARALLELNSEVSLVGWMARMTSVKNPHLMLEVAHQLPEIQFVMAGGGDLLQEIVRTAPPNVKVIGWTDASVFWSAVDCAVSTSDNEGMPIALIEAQLAGIPVVATDVGSNSEVVKHGLTGIVSNRNMGDLACEVQKMATNEEQRNAMGNAAETWARGQFSKLKMLQRHSAAYAELCDRL